MSNSIKVSIFVLLMVVVGNSALNVSRLLLLEADQITHFAWFVIAIVCAVCPAMVATFGDKQSMIIGYVSCLGSLMMSCWSITEWVSSQYNHSQNRESMIRQVEFKQSRVYQTYVKEIASCDRQLKSECDSNAKTDKYNKDMDKLDEKLEYWKTVKDRSENERMLLIVTLCLVALSLELWSTEFARQISAKVKPKRSNPKDDRTEIERNDENVRDISGKKYHGN